MDTILSEFIARTSADPGFARDVLEGHNWDLQKSLAAFYVLKGITNDPNLIKSSSLESGFVNKPLEILSGSNSQQQRVVLKPVETVVASSSSSSPPSKPPLRKADAFEIDDVGSKKLTRGISRATDNVNLVNRARNEFAQDFVCEGRESSPSHVLLETPVYTFTLPNLSAQAQDFREFLERDLIETSTLVSLEQAGRLNWWAEMGACQRLWPLATTGDGNCLLHAASLGMWGFHDRLLTLRRALHSVLTKSSFTEAFYRRWRWQTALQNKEAGLVYCEDEWNKEWRNLIQMASTEPRARSQPRPDFNASFAGKGTLDTVLEEESQPRVYESLEEIHVLALSHVLRRPIIVIADTMLKDVTGEPFAPIPFGGIYLPLECTPSDCHRSPLCLTYDAAHFSALVAMERDYSATLTARTVAAIPLTDPDHKLLSIQFAVDPGLEVNWGHDENDAWIISKLTLTEKDRLGLLNEYLDIIDIPLFAVSRNDLNDPFRSTSGSLVNGHSDDDYRKGGGGGGSSFESEESLSGNSSSNHHHHHHKSKAAKQLQSVAKQFGSLGRSVSKKIKKNFTSLAKRSASFKGGDNNATTTAGGGEEGARSTLAKNNGKKSGIKTLPSNKRELPDEMVRNLDGIVAAVLHTDKRHEYQEEMIHNYLTSARARFEKEKEIMSKQGIERKQYVPQPTVPCVNPGCSMYGTAATNYLCSACFSSQKSHEVEMKKMAVAAAKLQDGALVTPGNSAFYTESDSNMLASVARVPVVNRYPPRKTDQTLYLAKSVFYRDGVCESHHQGNDVRTISKDLKVTSEPIH